MGLFYYIINKKAIPFQFQKKLETAIHSKKASTHKLESGIHTNGLFGIPKTAQTLANFAIQKVIIFLKLISITAFKSSFL